jgi:hypothetical protein
VASAAIVTAQLPGASAVSVNCVPEGWVPGGVAAQTGFEICCTITGIDAGVPGATEEAFVSVACAVTVVLPPTVIVGAAGDALT